MLQLKQIGGQSGEIMIDKVLQQCVADRENDLVAMND